MSVINKENFDKNVELFLKQLREDSEGRNKSWEYCRKYFKDVFCDNKNHDEKEKDQMALLLYYYLASWGMLRNSFLLQKNYKVLIGLIENLEKDETHSYFVAFNENNSKNFDEEYVENILKQANIIERYFKGKKVFKDNEMKPILNVTRTLITKILMGLYGNIPAYDKYFMKGLEWLGINKNFNQESLRQLCELVQKNFALLKAKSKEIDDDKKINPQTSYSLMKIIDMYVWELGGKI